MLKVVNQGTHVPVVDVVDGVATVESTNIAEVFEKRHDHVLRDIENILISLPSERRDNFIEIQLDRINNFQPTLTISPRDHVCQFHVKSSRDFLIHPFFPHALLETSGVGQQVLHVRGTYWGQCRMLVHEPKSRVHPLRIVQVLD